MNHKPKIALITTGGTIASVAGKTGEAIPELTSKALLEAVPQIQSIADIQPIDLFTKPSSSLTLQDLNLLKEQIESLASSVDGIVITHGTDLMEITSFAFSLLVDLEIPVVLTGAMRRPDLPGADGPANLLDACRVATSSQSRGMGILAVMNGEILAGLFVKKQHSFLPHAFSNNPIGWVAEDRVRFFFKENIKKPSLTLGTYRASVLVVEAGFDFSSEDLALFDLDKVDAIVFSMAGVGHASEQLTVTLQEIAEKVPTVFASRTGTGETYKDYYGYPGSERDLIDRGLIPSGYLNSRQARTLLLLAYSNGVLSHSETEQLFSTFN